ncbi:hypothetical protein AAFA46_04060 [Oscillospiraceae bacterium WX1]
MKMTALWNLVLLSVVVAVGLSGCAASIGTNTAKNEPTAPAQLIADATLYEKYGLSIAIPNTYADQLLVFNESKWVDS